MSRATYVPTLRCNQDDDLDQKLDTYSLVELTIVERISGLSRYDLRLTRVSSDEELKALGEKDLLGSNLTIELTPEGHDGPTLRRHAEVCEVEAVRFDLEGDSVRLSLRLTLVPRFWRSTPVATQEIYLGQTLPQILTTKLAGVGLEAGYLYQLLESYPSRDLVTQVDETDHAFISRWIEREGIGYFFDHTQDEDVVVFTDHNTGYGDGATIGDDVRIIEARHRVTRRDRLVSRFYGVDDYNYRTPSVSLLHMHELEQGYAGGVLDFGGHHKTPEEALRQASLRAEASLGQRRQLLFEGANAGVCAGFRCLSDDALGAQQEILVVEATHHLAPAPETEGGVQTGALYRNSFVAVPTDTPYRPLRVTPWPRMLGLRTGVIEPGPGGQLNGIAQLDPEGRYTVQLHYDSIGDARAKASHPVRMAQTFAGPNQGMHFPLRPGTEVVLAYVNGDPDRPIIVGAVPNPETRSPVRAQTANRNRITTASGVLMEISEGR